MESVGKRWQTTGKPSGFWTLELANTRVARDVAWHPSTAVLEERPSGQDVAATRRGWQRSLLGLTHPCGATTSDLTYVCCIVTLYTVISSFRHRGLEKFFRTGSKAGIQPKHAARLRLQLFALDNAKTPSDMNAPGWRLHALAGSLAGHWAVNVSGNWRLTFKFEDEDALQVDYQDYH